MQPRVLAAERSRARVYAVARFAVDGRDNVAGGCRLPPASLHLPTRGSFVRAPSGGSRRETLHCWSRRPFGRRKAFGVESEMQEATKTKHNANDED